MDECPNCLRPLNDHWFLGMNFAQLDVWSADELVCALTQSEVANLLKSHA